MVRTTLKWLGIVLGGLVGLLLVVLVVLLLMGGARARQTYDVPVTAVSVPTDAAAIARGEHLATIYICTDCHGADLGGDASFSIPGMLTMPTPNLTAGAGGLGGMLSIEDWVRAIRHGVGHDGRGLFIMPSNSYTRLDDADVGALIAYAKSVPPVDSALPARQIAPLGRVMWAAGMFPPLAVDKIDHAGAPPAAPAPGTTAAYGGYLALTCHECHGADLNGAPFGPPGQEVPTPNLTPGGPLAAWSQAQFVATLRTGVTPDGHQLSEEMPWKNYGQMTDAELEALWLYLRSLPAQGG